MKAYAIKDTKGRVLMESCQLKAYQSKSWFESYNSWVNCGWKNYYKRGYRCVPVEITEIKPKPLSGEPLKALQKAIKASAKKSTELKDRK